MEEALAVLAAGGVVMHPTETCYGIACDLTNPAAVQKLFGVKARPFDQPVSALFPSLEAASVYVDVLPKAAELAKEHLPGPLTLVLPKKSDASKLWITANGNGDDRMIGVRISSHAFAAELATQFGKPIATTSANIHGQPSPYSPAEIERQFTGHSPAPDLLISEGELAIASPSTVVSVTRDGMRILRQGALVIEEEGF